MNIFSSDDCPIPDVTNDQYCHDVNNIAECDWDGGDCCYSKNPDWNSYCDKCACLDPKFDLCFNRTLLNDTLCHDENNVEECHWDGGDCCYNKNPNWNLDCKVCQCLDPQYDSCFNATLMNDKSCQDGNNILECHWDGGDCCHEEYYEYYYENGGWDQFCEECKCLDPNAQPDFQPDTHNDCDGSDCCNNNSPDVDDYCDDCTCLPPDPDHCPYHHARSDLYCDDLSNILACDWDGRACCKNEYPFWNIYCEDCLCLDPMHGGM